MGVGDIQGRAGCARKFVADYCAALSLVADLSVLQQSTGVRVVQSSLDDAIDLRELSGPATEEAQAAELNLILTDWRTDDVYSVMAQIEVASPAVPRTAGTGGQLNVVWRRSAKQV